MRGGELTPDPLAAGHGIRLIVVDRPGTGATPMVPLPDRVDTSCRARPWHPDLTAEQIASVLEHLDVKPAHMLATSAGV
jgi:pimeloyl-ACP methyl ester carboxylesterase